jgi:hypothetical protein
MLTRRNTFLGAAATGAVAAITQSCSSGLSHEEVARSLCWKFRMHEHSITIERDLLRRCPVVGPDDHHLFVSLGCSTENLALAALANGLQADARFDPTGSGTVAVSLEATQAQSSRLFSAISQRQCSRSDYDGRPLSTEELRLLEHAGTSTDVRLVLLTERTAMEKVLEYVVAANTAQMNAPAFIDELTTWIRFSADEATRTGDGCALGRGGPVLRALCAAGDCTWNPQYLPEPTGRGRVDPTKVRLSAWLGETAARSGGSFWLWADDAPVHATASAGRSGLILRVVESGCTDALDHRADRRHRRVGGYGTRPHDIWKRALG